jgi:glyoxylase-like metal-dependent hydrolase (beta-lactamase superfamily II)
MTEGVGQQLVVGERLQLGDEDFEVLHAPEHSSDSVCLYSAKSGIVFSGDTPLVIRSTGGTYDERFELLLEDLVSRGVYAVYSGHDPPIIGNAQAMITESLHNIRKGRTHEKTRC